MGDEVRLNNIDLIIEELNTLKVNKGWHFLGIQMEQGYLNISPVGFINSNPVHLRPASFKVGVSLDGKFIVEDKTPWCSWVVKQFNGIGECMMHIKTHLEDNYTQLRDVYKQEVEEFLSMGFEVMGTRLVYSDGTINYTIRVSKGHKFTMSIEEIDTMAYDMRLIQSFEFNEMSERDFKELRDTVKTLLSMETKVYQVIKNIESTLHNEVGMYKSKIGSHIK